MANPVAQDKGLTTKQNETVIQSLENLNFIKINVAYEEFNLLTYPLFRSDKLAGLEITILDPDLDINGQFAKDFVFNFTTTFNNATL